MKATGSPRIQIDDPDKLLQGSFYLMGTSFSSGCSPRGLVLVGTLRTRAPTVSSSAVYGEVHRSSVLPLTAPESPAGEGYTGSRLCLSSLP